MKVTILGTGTSQGIPVIGCGCATCKSEDPRDNRLRTSVHIEIEEISILIDTSPDLRQQMLINKIDRVDAVLYTHEHNDHVIGLDDIRPFNFRQRADIPMYGLKRVMDQVRNVFHYAFAENAYPGAPRAIVHEISGDTIIDVLGIKIQPVHVMHGNLPILGYRIGDFTFVTDASYMSDNSMELIRNSKVLVLNALQDKPHHSHYALDEALEIIVQSECDKAYVTHLSHVMGPVKSWEHRLPNHVESAYDGLQLRL